MKIVQRADFDFAFDPGACRHCPGYCCYGRSGKIWVNRYEIEMISSRLQINTVDCIRKYLERTDNRFSVRERFTELGFECVFFNSQSRQCSIYEARPEQCRQFPFWEHFREDREQLGECPGIRNL